MEPIDLAYGVHCHECSHCAGVLAIIGSFDKPTRDVIERLPALHAAVEYGCEVNFVFLRLPLGTQIKRIPADVRLAFFVFEIDLSVI